MSEAISTPHVGHYPHVQRWMTACEEARAGAVVVRVSDTVRRLACRADANKPPRLPEAEPQTAG